MHFLCRSSGLVALWNESRTMGKLHNRSNNIDYPAQRVIGCYPPISGKENRRGRLYGVCGVEAGWLVLTVDDLSSVWCLA